MEKIEKRRRLVWIGGSLAGGLILAVLISRLSLTGQGQPASRLISDLPQSAVSEPSAPAVYRILGEWEGRLAIFFPGEPFPEQVYEVRLITLPQEEQERLSAGIPVESVAALSRYLEDYTG